MFRGLSSINIDAKGRMAIPARYREEIQEESNGLIVVTIDTDERCLLMYPYPEWEQIEEKLQTLPSFDQATRRVQRLLIGHATELELDRSGRILLPSLLREYAGLGQSVMLVGQGNKFEIWGDSQWQMARDAWLTDESGGKDLPDALQWISL